MFPPLPEVGLDVVRDRTAESQATGGFLDVRRVDLVVRTPGRPTSAPFAYDMATRASIDAAVMAAHYRDAGVVRVFLRSSLRPPIALRTTPPVFRPVLWELPAGLIDGDETPREAAARELAEELGFDVDPARFADLGPPTFPAPAFIAENHHFFHVEVDPRLRATPREDGSVLERGAIIADVTLEEALDHCRHGGVGDAKTELGLRRLAEILR